MIGNNSGRTGFKSAASFSIGAIVYLLGELIGLGGAEFRLPLLIQPFFILAACSFSTSLYIDGKGTIRLKGKGPRFHIHSTAQYSGFGPVQKIPPQSFVKVDATGYFRRITTGGSAYAGGLT